MHRCAGEAESRGVFYCLENVGQPFCNTPEQVSELVHAIDSPAVSVYYDPGNAFSNGLDPLRGIDLLGTRVGQVHVKEIGGKLLGEGHMPWKQIIAGLMESGYDGWLILETDPTEQPRRAAMTNLRTLQILLQA
jgi:sugar phosphate isomerase/epimerase